MTPGGVPTMEGVWRSNAGNSGGGPMSSNASSPPDSWQVRPNVNQASPACRIKPLEPGVLFAGGPAGFVDEQVTPGLTNPPAMEFAPDGRLFVPQQGGALRVVKNGALLTTL